MKHLRTTIIVAVLHVSTMCTTESVVLGVGKEDLSPVSKSFPNPIIKKKKNKIPLAKFLKHVKDRVPFCQRNSDNEEKKENPSMKALLKTVQTEVKIEEFSMASKADQENLSLTSKQWTRQWNAMEKRIPKSYLLARYRTNESYPKAFLQELNTLDFRWIAESVGEEQEYFRDYFMHQYWAHLSQHSTAQRNELLQLLPRNLLVYGHNPAHYSAYKTKSTLQAIRKSTNMGAQEVLPFTAEALWSDPVFALASVKKRWWTINLVNHKKIDTADYYEIARKAVEKNGWAIKYVKYQKRHKQDYYEIARKAVEKNGRAIKYVKYQKRHKQDYYDTVLEAVKDYEWALLYVKPKVFSEAKYKKLEREAARTFKKRKQHQLRLRKIGLPYGSLR